MFHSYRIQGLLLVLGLWAVWTSSAHCTPAVPEGILEAARDGLPRFLSIIPRAELEHYGFHDQEEVVRATLGEPFLVHTLWPSEILARREGKVAEIPIHSTTLWQFPVICDGTPRTLLTVDRMAGEWMAVDLGGLSPAPEMEELADRWSPADGYELGYVRVFQTGSQFISVTRNGATRLVPLEWTARSLQMLRSEELFDYRPMGVAEIASILAPFVRASLEGM